MLDAEGRKTVVTLCRELVRTQSYSGQEGGVAEKLRLFMESHGFDDVFIDAYGSITGRIKGAAPGPKVLFDGHIDTVPVPDPALWRHDPFGAEMADGKIYGRGTSDMKGAVAAMACAAANFAAATGRRFAGELYVSGVVHEECFEGIAARAVSQRVNPDFVVIGEASELNLKIGQRGRAEIVVETFGVPAHSANPDKGVDAVYSMMKLAEKLRGIEPVRDPILGAGVAVLTDIISTPYPGASVVPSHCRATYDRRLLVGEKPADVLAPFERAIRELEKTDPKFKAAVSYAKGRETCYTGAVIEGERFFPGWLFDEQNESIAKALSGLRAVGLNPAISHYSFCTNGSHYAGERGITTIGFGPSRENLAHTIDEYIEEEQLFAATAGYAGIAQALLQSV